MFGFGLQELIVVFLVIFILFGAKAIPEIAKGLGQAIRILRKEKKSMEKDLDTELVDTEKLSHKNDSGNTTKVE